MNNVVKKMQSRIANVEKKLGGKITEIDEPENKKEEPTKQAPQKKHSAGGNKFLTDEAKALLKQMNGTNLSAVTQLHQRPKIAKKQGRQTQRW